MTKHNFDRLPTVAEHREFGLAVKEFQLALGRMTTGTPNGLGFWRFPKTSRQAKALMRVSDALVTLKSVMDDDICVALPMSDDRATRFYYSPDAIVEELETDKEQRVPNAAGRTGP